MDEFYTNNKGKNFSIIIKLEIIFLSNYPIY